MPRTWILPVLLLAGCGKKNVEPPAPIVGWHTEEGWLGSCYFPPDYASLGTGDVRIARNETREMMMQQWQGNRGDGVSFDPDKIIAVETVLLGTPEKVEAVSRKNAELCQTAMTSGGTVAWSRWLDELPGKLMAGECRRPLDYTLFDYLDIANDWQIPAPVCAEDVIRVKGSTIDHYRIEDKGKWITVEGDPDKPAYGDYPCTLEDCLVGQLVMRFRADSGMELVLPVGKELVWTVPEHGRIDVMINDTSFFDNEYKIESGMQHHTSIEYSPL